MDSKCNSEIVKLGTWMDILFTPVEKLSNEDKTICFGMRVLLEIEAIDILTPVFLKQLQFANT